MPHQEFLRDRRVSTLPRVAFLINELRCGGAQRVFVGDANSFVRAGVRVLFCTLYRKADDDSLARELDPSIECVWLGARGPFDVRAVIRCAQALRSAGTTVLITTLNDANILGRWVALTSGLRVRLIRREASTDKPLWQRVLDLPFDALSHRILAVSEEVRRTLLRRAAWRARKVIVLRNAVPLPPCATRDTRAAPRILSVGRMTRQKDHSLLITALGILARAGHDFTAEIVGAGTLSGLLHDRAMREGISERVVFRGALAHAAVLREYSRADIFALPSRCEGCPNVVLEAMAHGVPVIATAVGGVPELVEHETSGLLVPPGDTSAFAAALARLVADADLRERMGRAARSRARLFAPDVRFERLYRLVTSA